MSEYIMNVEKDSDNVNCYFKRGEIIRCKDCKFRRWEETEGFYYCALEDRPNRNWSINDTDFCSWAEREMTKKEAVKILKGIAEEAGAYPSAVSYVASDEDVEALIMAIEALTAEPKWIPVTERLPEENEPVLVGIKYKDDFKMFVTARMDVTYWQGLGRDIKGEMRWMPLPEPYVEGAEQ